MNIVSMTIGGILVFLATWTGLSSVYYLRFGTFYPQKSKSGNCLFWTGLCCLQAIGWFGVLYIYVGAFPADPLHLEDALLRLVPDRQTAFRIMAWIFFAPILVIAPCLCGIVFAVRPDMFYAPFLLIHRLFRRSGPGAEGENADAPEGGGGA